MCGNKLFESNTLIGRNYFSRYSSDRTLFARNLGSPHKVASSVVPKHFASDFVPCMEVSLEESNIHWSSVLTLLLHYSVDMGHLLSFRI